MKKRQRISCRSPITAGGIWDGHHIVQKLILVNIDSSALWYLEPHYILLKDKMYNDKLSQLHQVDLDRHVQALINSFSALESQISFLDSTVEFSSIGRGDETVPNEA